MDKQEAIDKIKQWADVLEADIDAQYFEGVIEQLTMPVKNGRLDFNPENFSFKYKLFCPIEKADGETIELVDIKEISLNETKSIQNFKKGQQIDASMALLAKVCGIEMGFAGRLRNRDIAVINAVSLGFFVRQSQGSEG